MIYWLYPSASFLKELLHPWLAPHKIIFVNFVSHKIYNYNIIYIPSLINNLIISTKNYKNLTFLTKYVLEYIKVQIYGLEIGYDKGL